MSFMDSILVIRGPFSKQSVILRLRPAAAWRSAKMLDSIFCAIAQAVSKDQFCLPFPAYSENRSVPPSANPEGIGITQPRVARHELPWVGLSGLPTLKELNPIGRRPGLSLIQPFQGWFEMKCTQGRRCYGNPGLSDHNPVGVAEVSP